MNDLLLARARECRYCQPALRELAGLLPPEEAALDALLAEAVAQRDELAFTHLVLAALDAGRRLEARHLVHGSALFPNPGLLATVAMHVQGEVALALLQAVAGGRMAWERESTALLVAGIWCRDQHKDFPPELIARARILARQAHEDELLRAPLLGLATLTGDQGLRGILAPSPPEVAAAERFREELARLAKTPPLSMVPEAAGPRVLSGFTVRRAVARVGRNEPCPCGSGKKYKHCCLDKDQERLQQSSSVAGVTREELRQQVERHLTQNQLLTMRSFELARLDPAKVAPALRPVLINRLLLYDEHEAVVRLFAAVGVLPELAGHWRDALEGASRSGSPDCVRRLLEVAGGQAPPLAELGVAPRLLLLEGPNPALELIEATVLNGLRNPGSTDLVELAYALLEGRSPALGILVARGVIPLASYFDAATLFEVLLETRDKLFLPPEDPVEELVDWRQDKESVLAKEHDEALGKSFQVLEAKNREVRQLRTELRTLHGELEKRVRQHAAPAPVSAATPTPAAPVPPAAPTPAAAAPPDDRVLTELRRRLEDLKVNLKERHAERNQLRRELETARDELARLRQKTAPPPVTLTELEQTENTLLVAADFSSSQPVRLPVFPKKFSETLAALPPHVARAAMILTGRLAAGEPAAFAGAKRLQLNHEVVRQRVGADYRLFFRLSPDACEVIDLINRKDLERKVKTLAGR